MFSSRSNRALTAVVAIVASVVVALTSAVPASAGSGGGVGDISAAVLYEASSPIGSILETIDNGDDKYENVALPFAINYNGVLANALCVTTNGYVVPIATIASTCSAAAYDQSLSEGAKAVNLSTIGVLLHDLWAGAPVWAGPGVDLVSYDVTAGVATFHTSAPHGYSAGDEVNLWFSTADPDYFDQGVRYVVVDTVVDPTTFTFLISGPVPDIASHSVVGQTRIPYNDLLDDSDSDGHADDGFGAVNQVYAGPTTVGGKPAFAVTWYRVTSYETLNSPTLTDTFQIVIVQDATTDGATAGYLFTVHFNFATVADNELPDGYDATAPNSECDVLTPVNCRFAVGFSFYNAATDTATSQELFATIPKADLIDGGSRSLVTNSLNSGVPGRYVLQYSGLSQLAATGTDSVPIGFAALALLSAGGVLMVVRRRNIFAS